MPDERTYLLRNEIARLIGDDPKLVRAYEELQRAALENLPELIEDATLSLESLDARVDVVEDALTDGATTLQDEGVSDDVFHTINFVGAGVSAEIDPAGVAKVTVPGAAAAAWALAGTGTGHAATGVYDFATDGAQALMDFTGLGSFNELLIVARGVSYTNSGVRIVYVSVDNGTTFFTTSGDYQVVSNAGVEAAATGFNHSTGTTAARSLVVHILNTKGAVKQAASQNTGGAQMLFVASASDINAIRFTNSGGGNSGAGTVRVYAR